jgi:hypothetical protein
MGDMACADVATAKAKAAKAINLTIVFLHGVSCGTAKPVTWATLTNKPPDRSGFCNNLAEANERPGTCMSLRGLGVPGLTSHQVCGNRSGWLSVKREF